ncbi:MAG TPA: AraC family transcriptional regulator [Aggregatilinea sp.]|jgi:hypothetical protein|uniref:helix-turn-helix transcriptional regulator n=1 Tax=Aggregatilinea sp. TaxID=2806333 RepID=UPI002C578131|nr:AraC family transcriptional regulator [Aggregatilinea sp.]HML21135.1 AraC family transcriptional regulator [Aggregatilinea sp.]
MDLTCEERVSDSPFIERVWRSRSEQAGSFVSMANTRCEMVVTRWRNTVMMTMRGPETRATPAFGVPDAEFLGITFSLGTFMPLLPAKKIRDRCDANLPLATSRTFWLQGRAWQFPDFDNAETFIDWLVRDGLLVRDTLVRSVLNGELVRSLTPRTLQRRFLQATGLTHGAVRQIERARYATLLLKQGVSILDVVEQAGYADQPHLTRSLKHLIGQTPAQILSANRTEPLSFLFKTAPF